MSKLRKAILIKKLNNHSFWKLFKVYTIEKRDIYNYAIYTVDNERTFPYLAGIEIEEYFRFIDEE